MLQVGAAGIDRQTNSANVYSNGICLRGEMGALLVVAGRTVAWWVNIHALQICFQITVKIVDFLKIFACCMRIPDAWILRVDNWEFTVFRSKQYCNNILVVLVFIN
jgi:hypothetical protein